MDIGRVQKPYSSLNDKILGIFELLSSILGIFADFLNYLIPAPIQLRGSRLNDHGHRQGTKTI